MRVWPLTFDPFTGNDSLTRRLLKRAPPFSLRNWERLARFKQTLDASQLGGKVALARDASLRGKNGPLWND